MASKRGTCLTSTATVRGRTLAPATSMSWSRVLPLADRVPRSTVPQLLGNPNLPSEPPATTVRADGQGLGCANGARSGYHLVLTPPPAWPDPRRPRRRGAWSASPAPGRYTRSAGECHLLADPHPFRRRSPDRIWQWYPRPRSPQRFRDPGPGLVAAACAVAPDLWCVTTP